MKKASPNRKPAPAQGHLTTTSPKGRRAVTSLWYAIRALNGAALTHDDLALIREALAEIAKAVQP